MKRKRLIPFNHEDAQNVMNTTELVLSLTLSLQKKLKNQNVFVDESLLLPLVKEELLLYLGSKRKFKLKSDLIDRVKRSV